MDAVIQKGICTAAKVARIKCVRKYKGIHLLGDMVLCDSQTVD